jgi:epoxide hydrolase-like predicted phosphatase
MIKVIKDEKMAIRAVIWDIGGVLVRTEDYEPRRRLAERLGLSREALETLVFGSEMGQKAQMGMVSAKELLEYACREVHYPVEETTRFEEEFFAGDRLDEELVGYIRSLRSHYRTGIISNAWDDVGAMIERRWKMPDAFDQIVLSAEVKLGKPDPRIFYLALEKLQVAPQEAVFIDDVDHNVAGARAVGMHAIQFRSSEQVRAELNEFLKSA